jgi:CRISPR system Cascade subunit CasD
LKNPVYPLFLGRRSCPPTLPLSLGLRPLPLLEALRAEPWQTALWRQKQLDPELKIIADVSSGEMGNALYEDVPVSFSPLHRQFSYRMVAEYGSVKKIITDQDHDPMAELG